MWTVLTLVTFVYDFILYEITGQTEHLVTGYYAGVLSIFLIEIRKQRGNWV